MKQPADMTDEELTDTFDRVWRRYLALSHERAARRIALLRLLKPDPDQQDQDEYVEEMSVGGKPYRIRR